MPGKHSQLRWHLLLSKLTDLRQWDRNGSRGPIVLSRKLVKTYLFGLEGNTGLFLLETDHVYDFKADQCLGSLRSTPLCADINWSLWNSTLSTNRGLFCCLPGLVGLKTGGCVSDSTVTSLNLVASLVSQNPPCPIILG